MASFSLLSPHPLLPPSPSMTSSRPCLRLLIATSATTYPFTPTTFRRLTRRVAVAESAQGGGGRRGPDDGDLAFLDEDGTAEDMDGYLNHLSLEYDSVWDTKPSWCQPWTILLAGVTVSACSWVFLHSILATAIVSCLIGAWWYIFLYAYPKEYSEMIAERRKNVIAGIEDTFGSKKTENPQI